MTIRERWRCFSEVPESFPGLVVAGFLRNQLLWDGDCGFCAAMVTRLAAFARTPFRATPYQEVRAELPIEVLKWSTRQMHWLSPAGGVFGGSLALSAVLTASGHRFLGGLLQSRFLRPVSWLGYRLVAANRSSVGELTGTHCVLPKNTNPGERLK